MRVGEDLARTQNQMTCQPCAEDLAGLFHEWIEERVYGNTVSFRSQGITR
jgi:hypothetical protein